MHGLAFACILPAKGEKKDIENNTLVDVKTPMEIKKICVSLYTSCIANIT